MIHFKLHLFYLLQMTLSALVVTIIFILTFSYNLWYYLLGTVGVYQFQTSDFHQLLSTWFTSFNCFVNPVVYFLMMSGFRTAVKKTFCFCFIKKGGNTKDELDKSQISTQNTET